MKSLAAILLLVISTFVYADEFAWDFNKTVHENFLAMEYDLQLYTLAFFVRESGHNCSPVFRGYQGGTEENGHYWMIGCREGTDWSVLLADDGYQVMNCQELEQFIGYSCLSGF